MAKGAYSALQQGRVDQGVDFGGAGPVGAVADGTVKSVGLWNGWPGSGGVVYSIANGRNIFVMEDFAPSVHVGQHVHAGEIIGHATGPGGGPYGIETGFANADGTTPAVRYNGLADGTPTAGGKAFAAFLAGGTPSPSSSGGGGGILDTILGGPTSATQGAYKTEKAVVTDPVAAIKALPSGLFDAAKKYALPVFLTVILVLGGLALVGVGVTRSLTPGGTT